MTMKETSLSKTIKKQSGFVEISLPWVMLIVAILAGVALAVVIPLMSDASVKALNGGNSLIVKNIRANYRNTDDFNGLTNSVAVQMKVAPADWMSGSSTIGNPVGGTLTVVAEDLTGTDDGFSISNTLLNEVECNDHVNHAFPLAYKIEVGSTVVKAAGATSLAPATLAAACDNASNTVKTYYTKI